MTNLMRLLTTILVALTGAQRVLALSASDALAELPTCALTCLVTAIEASPCSLTNVTCQCTNTELTVNATACIKLACTVEQALFAKNATMTQCGAPVRDKRASYNAVNTALVVISVIFTFVRVIYKAFFMSSGLGIDDWIILVTALAGVASGTINIRLLSGNGLGTDIWTQSADNITAFAKAFYIDAILYFLDVSLLKLSILFFYLRIFPSRIMQHLLWGTIVFNILFGIAFVLASTFQCLPISYSWAYWRGLGGGTCINISAMAWANAAISIAMDIWMLSLPLSQLRALNMHWKKKVGVAMMFFVGTFVTVVSIIRLSSLVEFRATDNLTWDYQAVSLWSSVEITVGIICACMPTMRVILVKAFPVILGSTQRRTNQQGTDKYNLNGSHSGGGVREIGTGKSSSTRSRSSWRPNIITTWSVTHHPADGSFSQNRQFTRVSSPIPEEFGADGGRLVQLETFEGGDASAALHNNWGYVETKIYGGSTPGSDAGTRDEEIAAPATKL
ncbi:hypothetical protein BX600DRAFT_475714 [Xylariales sp. PMI_506]|nr:hypothetical protein BX600DRAFT_475714 [Xylariales sp. PMI_506]